MKPEKRVKNYKVGDLVLRPGLCNNDKYYSLWGGFAEFTTVADCMSMEEDGIAVEDVSLKIQNCCTSLCE